MSELNIPAKFTRSYSSGNQVITGAGSLTLAHGLGVKPSLILMKLVCQTAEHNYSIGDEFYYMHADTTDLSGRGFGATIVMDATNLNVRYGANGVRGLNKTTGAAVDFTLASWRAVFEAYA